MGDTCDVLFNLINNDHMAKSQQRLHTLKSFTYWPLVRVIPNTWGSILESHLFCYSRQWFVNGKYVVLIF